MSIKNKTLSWDDINTRESISIADMISSAFTEEEIENAISRIHNNGEMTIPVNNMYCTLRMAEKNKRENTKSIFQKEN